MDHYGYEVAEAIGHTFLEQPKYTIRIQPLKISHIQAMEYLEKEGYEVRKSKFSSQGIVVEKGNILQSELWKNGKIIIQDESSMLVAEQLKLEHGMKVLDTCSAPGGKTTHIAETMKNVGEIHAYDIHEKKLKRFEKMPKS